MQIKDRNENCRISSSFYRNTEARKITWGLAKIQDVGFYFLMQLFFIFYLFDVTSWHVEDKCVQFVWEITRLFGSICRQFVLN